MPVSEPLKYLAHPFCFIGFDRQADHFDLRPAVLVFAGLAFDRDVPIAVSPTAGARAAGVRLGSGR
jgi:hypothetical protein